MHEALIVGTFGVIAVPALVWIIADVISRVRAGVETLALYRVSADVLLPPPPPVPREYVTGNLRKFRERAESGEPLPREDR